MNLHDAIFLVLKENINGLSLYEITKIINEKKLYENNNKSLVNENQIVLRINNFSHLFYVDNGKIFAHRNFEKSKLLFDHIIHDIIASTSDDAISAKHTIIPFLVFLKRTIEAYSINYDIKVSIPFREWYEEFETDISTGSPKEYQNNLIEAINDLSEENWILDSFRLDLIELIRKHKPEMLMKIHLVLNKYSLGSDFFTKKEFGFFFNTLVERLSKSAAHSGRSFTPDDINKIITSLYNDQVNLILDPFAGTGGTLIKRQRWNASAKAIGYEISKDSWLTGSLNLIMNGIDPLFFHHSNSLNITGIFKKKASLVVSDIPFGGSFKPEELDFLHWSKTKDPTSIYLQYILDSLDENGKAVVVIPNAFLFNGSSSIRQLKSLLLENGWLEAVISLPQGILQPYSGLSTSIICLNKNRPGKKNCLFVDASNIHHTKINENEQYIDDDSIDEIIKIFQSKNYENISVPNLNAANISPEEIQDQGYDLTPKRYIKSFDEELQLNLFHDNGDEIIELGSILSKINETAGFDSGSIFKVVQAKDLKSSPFDFILKSEQIKEKKFNSGRSMGHLEKNALLISTYFKSHKPTYFIYEDQPVVIPNYIKAFNIDESYISKEYLLLQLHEPYFIKQLDTIRKGTSQAFFSIKDFLTLKIRVPSNLEQQKSYYEKAKEKDLEKLLGEVNVLRGEIVKMKGEAITDQITIISSIQHELGNKLPALKNTIDDLKYFILQTTNTSGDLLMESRIRPTFPGENEKDIDTVKSVFDRIENILNYTISMVDDAGGIINSDPSKFKPQKVKLIEYLKSEIDNFQKVHGQMAKIRFELPDEEGPLMNIDKKQFSKAMNNLINNAIRHGFTDKNKEYHMVFQLTPDDLFDILIIKNDGNPFTEDFTIEKYKQPYQYAGNNGHSGLGGYIVNRVIENHGGVMDILKDIDPADSFKVQFEFKFPKVYFL